MSWLSACPTLPLPLFTPPHTHTFTPVHTLRHLSSLPCFPSLRELAVRLPQLPGGPTDERRRLLPGCALLSNLHTLRIGGGMTLELLHAMVAPMAKCVG